MRPEAGAREGREEEAVKLAILLLMAVSAFGQATAASQWITFGPPAPKYKLPQYLLVTRYYSSLNTCLTVNPPRCSDGGWSYSYTAYASLADVLKELNARGRYNTPTEIVGVFRLDDKSEVKIVSKKVQVVIPKHIEEEKWEETEWSVEKKP